MKETKKIRVKVKKRKLKFKKLLLFIVVLTLFINSIYYLLTKKINNIYIINNNIVSDKEIIEQAGLKNYPSYLLNLSFILEKKIKNNPYIKEVEIKKKNFKVYIYITEYKLIAIYDNKVLLENNTLLENTYNNKELPIIINEIDTEKFSKYFSKIEDNILLKISQIEYTPNEVDAERYLLYMNDGNSVYITLSKIEKLNKYNGIISQMEGKNGIIYLDSGDYIELK